MNAVRSEVEELKEKEKTRREELKTELGADIKVQVRRSSAAGHLAA